MRNENIDFELLWRKCNATLTESEEVTFKQWLSSSPNHKEYFNKVHFYYKKGKVYNKKSFDIPMAWRITYHNYMERKHMRKIKWLKIASAYAAVLLIGFTLYFTIGRNDIFIELSGIEEVNIPPGTKKATLILDDGSSIGLNENQKFKSLVNGTEIVSEGDHIAYKNTNSAKSKEITYNMLDVPRGGEFFIILSDSTKVWLNAETQLRYPVNFKGGERLVELTGEAYFEVTTNKKKPFKVKCGNQITEVTGTTFNINAYKDKQQIFTTLVEGNITIYSSSKPDGVAVKLTPGKQSSYNRVNDEIIIREVNVNDIIAWKNGIFAFRNKSLGDIMNTLTRWYDINIEFENKNVQNIRFTGGLKRYENFENILELIEKTREVEFGVIGNTIVIK